MSALLETADAVVAIAVDMCECLEDNPVSDLHAKNLNAATERYQMAAGPYRDTSDVDLDALAEWARTRRDEPSPMPRALPDDLGQLEPVSMTEARHWLRQLVGQLVKARGVAADHVTYIQTSGMAMPITRDEARALRAENFQLRAQAHAIHTLSAPGERS